MSQNSVSDGCNSVESQLIDFGQKNGDQVLQLKCVEHGNVVTVSSIWLSCEQPVFEPVFGQ